MKLPVTLFVLCFACSLSAAAETGTTVKDTELKKEPFIDAATLATLPGQTTVEILKRQGGWTQVKPPTADKGWVRMLNLRLGDGKPRQEGSGSGIGALFNVARSGSSGTTVTTGVRGLDITKDTLQNASPNPGELKRMHGFSVSKAEALKLAGSAKLHKQSVEYVEPGAVRPSGNASSSDAPASSWGNN
ncbi:MAG: SH3 domain-containing protein [Sulfuricella denitrificans]|nr:SH3 domain-containing protein [Sulfuricella denitrificans]